MSNAQVFELCKKCKTPSKMRIDFLGKVSYVDVVCKCNSSEETKKKSICKPTRKYYGER